MLLFVAFNLMAAWPAAARIMRSQAIAARPFARAGGHVLIVAVGAPLQFFAIACAVVFIHDGTLVLQSILDLHARILWECAAIWIAVYAGLVALDQWLARPHASDAELHTASRLRQARLVLHADGVDHVVDPGEISHVRAMGDYVQVQAGARRLVIKLTLAEVETMLGRHDFTRVHRGALVRTAAVAAVERRTSGAYEVRLACGARLPLSRRRLGEVRAALGVR